jgi:phosphomannomutase
VTSGDHQRGRAGAEEINPGIFKAYDIRGLYGEEMDEGTARAIGRAFARVLARLRSKQPGELRVGLGRDMRLTAPAMAVAVREGLVAEGATVLDAGEVATEVLYHLVGSRRLDGGAMVTASHNPKAYTGVKLIREGALPLSGDAGIGDVREEIGAGLGAEPGGGSFEEVDIWDEFHAHAMSFIDPARVKPMKVVVDGGNGMGGPMVGPILEKLPLELEEMYFEPDGEFPDHEPNPLLEENRRMIMERVTASGADLGIAWDGDADRCFFIDAGGEFCDGDFICALLARAALVKNPGATILYDPRSSRAVPDLVAAEGGRSDLSRVGHAFFKARMREEGAAFGGEVSGHYYFRDFWNADSGTIPALLMLELISLDGRTLRELMDEFRSRYFISGEINSEVADPAAKLAEIEARYGDGQITKLDGVSVDYEDWHFNVRPSNTEPLLRLNLESLASREDMERRRDEVLGLIRA